MSRIGLDWGGPGNTWEVLLAPIAAITVDGAHLAATVEASGGATWDAEKSQVTVPGPGRYVVTARGAHGELARFSIIAVSQRAQDRISANRKHHGGGGSAPNLLVAKSLACHCGAFDGTFESLADVNLRSHGV